MTWTYTPDFTANKDKVRFLVQDTDTNDQLVTNEEIAFVLTEHPNIYRAAAFICRSVALKLGRELSLSAPAIEWSADDQYRHYTELAERYESQAARSGGLAIYAGGISKADIDNREEDSDRVVPSFKSYTHDDSFVGDPLTQRSS